MARSVACSAGVPGEKVVSFGAARKRTGLHVRVVVRFDGMSVNGIRIDAFGWPRKLAHLYAGIIGVLWEICCVVACVYERLWLLISIVSCVVKVFLYIFVSFYEL